jgi:hypothetical protein
MKIERQKIIRKIGDSVGIIYNREERELFGLDVGTRVHIVMEKMEDK